MEQLALEMRNISKTFFGVQVLKNVNLQVRKGEVHVLLGENGAGKSTLMKILSGAYVLEEGDIFFEGEKVQFNGPKAAIDKGINIIYQEFNLNPYVPVYQNIFLGRELTKGVIIDVAEMIRRSKEVMDEVGLDVDPRTLVKDLSVAQKQLVEISKALIADLKVLVLDEPTAAITDKETEMLFEVIRRLKGKGVSIVYISHRMSELFEIGDRCTVLRDGGYVKTLELAKTNVDDLTFLMVNRKVDYDKIKNPFIKEKQTALSVNGLYYRNLLKDISFDLREGEILGISGLVGSGRTEMAKCIIGAYKRSAGTVLCRNGTVELDNHDIESSIKNGVVYLSEDRKDEGLILGQSIERNITLPNLSSFGRWILNTKRMPGFAKKYMDRLNVKATSSEQETVRLSGGNQQKVVIAKWLANNAYVYIFDEPTRGIDVGARDEIYNIMLDMLKEGAAIIMISSDLPEILRLSDRVLVMKEGEISAVLENDGTLCQQDILRYAL